MVFSHYPMHKVEGLGENTSFDWSGGFNINWQDAKSKEKIPIERTQLSKLNNEHSYIINNYLSS
jgi:hypothetical protein